MKTNQRGIMMQKSGKAIMTNLHTDTSSERVFSACNYDLDGESIDGWMNKMRFYNSPFNSISVISGRWVCDCERQCAMVPLDFFKPKMLKIHYFFLLAPL